jgi:L-alanine-DL-glutamate epimerase-like enolase superfamily enzyme
MMRRQGRQVVRRKEAGCTAFKFRAGTEWKNAGMTIGNYIPRVREVREVVRPGMDRMQEGNTRLTLDQCLALCPVLEALDFLRLEEPVRTSEPAFLDNHLRIRRAVKKVKVSGGESHGIRLPS